MALALVVCSIKGIPLENELENKKNNRIPLEDELKNQKNNINKVSRWTMASNLKLKVFFVFSPFMYKIYYL